MGRSNIVGLGALGRALRPLIPEDTAAVFFCVKAFDLGEALREQANLWPQDVPFVILSNGHLASILEELKPILAARPVRMGMTTMGARIDGDGVLHVYGEGAVTSWGNNGSAGNVPCTDAERKLIEMHTGWIWQDDIRPNLRRKWIFNTTLNTLCGALRMASNGKLINHKSLAEDVFSEAYHLGHELWAEIPPRESIAELRNEFWTLVERTKDNENSMARDVRLGKKTESQFLAGMSSGRRGYDKLKTYHAVLARLG